MTLRGVRKSLCIFFGRTPASTDEQRFSSGEMIFLDGACYPVLPLLTVAFRVFFNVDEMIGC